MHTSAHVWLASRTVCVSTSSYAVYASECDVQESTASLALGGNCDIDVNECDSSPCQNGATCTESSVESSVSFHAYQCTCVAGFANGVCEYDGDARDRSDPPYGFIVEYASECDVQESTASLELTGNCDIDVNECASSPCQNNATCSDSTSVLDATGVNSYSCACVAGFANGMCAYDFGSNYTDECTVTEGGNCDIDVDECWSYSVHQRCLRALTARMARWTLMHSRAGARLAGKATCATSIRTSA